MEPRAHLGSPTGCDHDIVSGHVALGVSSSSTIYGVRTFVEFWRWFRRSRTRIPRGVFAAKRFVRHRDGFEGTDVRQEDDSGPNHMIPNTKFWIDKDEVDHRSI